VHGARHGLRRDERWQRTIAGALPDGGQSLAEQAGGYLAGIGNVALRASSSIVISNSI
jgi:hypothetical protein